jgi:hypothetical protein
MTDKHGFLKGTTIDVLYNDICYQITKGKSELSSDIIAEELKQRYCNEYEVMFIFAHNK